MKTTGIAVFGYNRPDHMKFVLEKLRQNDVEHVYFFVDGPKTEEEEPRVEAVREIIKNVDWCRKTVRIHHRNVGLAESITSGVDRVLDDHDRIIVLEDDCIPANNFVSFMRTCLEKYANNERVMNVNGYSPPIKIPENYPYDVYFTHRSSSWGWGTWRSSWRHFEPEPISLQELKAESNKLKEITDKLGADVFPMMRSQLEGKLDSWAVWWGFAIAKNDGFCLNPVNSKIRNIGHDGTGTHSGKGNRYDIRLDNTPVDKMTFPEKPFINKKIDERKKEIASGGIRWKLKKKWRILINSLNSFLGK